MTYDLLALTYLFIVILVAILVSAVYFTLSYIRDVINPARDILEAAIEAIQYERAQTKEIHDALLTLNATLAQVLVASRRRPTQTTKLPALLPTSISGEQ